MAPAAGGAWASPASHHGADKDIYLRYLVNQPSWPYAGRVVDGTLRFGVLATYH